MLDDMNGIGAAIIVNGRIVAWFIDFNEEAQEWCSDNYFGEWMVWRANQPELIPLTQEQEENAKRRAEELSAFF